jgi:hypothetical protein
MAPGSPANPITMNLPSTLEEWRGYNNYPLITVWDPLRTWFSSQGLDIYEVAGETIVKPPMNELRTYDGTYGTHYAPPSIEHENRVCGL